MGDYDAEKVRLRKTIWALYDQGNIETLCKRVGILEQSALVGEGTVNPLTLARLELLKERLAELEREK